MNYEALAQQEEAEFRQEQGVRRRLFPRALLVGLASGLVAVAFRLALTLAENARADLLNRIGNRPWVSALTIGILVAVGTLFARALGKLEPYAGGSGIPHMKAVLEGHAPMNWRRLIAVKFSAAVAAIGSGLALGREGPTVQMGGAVGLGVAHLTRANPREERALAASGAGAGLAAAFNAPLAGVTFVLEEMQRDFQPVVFGATLLCATVATVVSRLALGPNSAFSVPSIAVPSLAALPEFALIGALGGVLAVGFNRGLLAVSDVLKRWPVGRVAGLAGVMAAGCVVVSPHLLGGGHALTEEVWAGQSSLVGVCVLLLVRFAFVQVSYGTGVPGGIFAPLLSLGALMGAVVFHLSDTWHLGGLGVAACAVAGMCALFSGVVRAPLTGIILIAEMTASYDLLLPLLVAAFTAYAVAEAFRDLPIYEALLLRMASPT